MENSYTEEDIDFENEPPTPIEDPRPTLSKFLFAGPEPDLKKQRKTPSSVFHPWPLQCQQPGKDNKISSEELEFAHFQSASLASF